MSSRNTNQHVVRGENYTYYPDYPPEEENSNTNQRIKRGKNYTYYPTDEIDSINRDSTRNQTPNYDEDFDPEYFDGDDIPPDIMQKIYDVQKYMNERRNAAKQQNSARQRNSSPQRMPIQRMPIDNTPLPPVGQTGQNERVPFFNYPPRVGQSVSGYRPKNADPRISINGMPSVQENLRNNYEYEDEYEDNHYYEPLYDESYSPYLAGGRNSNRRSNR